MNRAGDPAYAARMGEYAAKMLTWRLGFAERTLTGYRATPKGLEVRAFLGMRVGALVVDWNPFG